MAQRRMRGLQTAGTHEGPSVERRRPKASQQDAFLASLDTEIDTQEAQIRQCRIRLAALRAVRKRYTEGHVIGSLQQPEVSSKTRAPRRQQSQKNIIVSAVNDLLRSQNGPVPTKTILDRLLRGGIKVGGGNPARFLSVVLSTSGRFVAHGHSGWTLVNK